MLLASAVIGRHFGRFLHQLVGLLDSSEHLDKNRAALQPVGCGLKLNHFILLSLQGRKGVAGVMAELGLERAAMVGSRQSTNQ
jgi:hypothetical protein